MTGDLTNRVESIRAAAVEVVTGCDRLLAALTGGAGQGGAERLTATWVRTPPTYLTAALTPDEVRTRLRPDSQGDPVGPGDDGGPGHGSRLATPDDPAHLARADGPDPDASK